MLAGLLVFGKHESIKEYLPHYNVEYIRKSSNIENASYSDRLIYDGYWGEDNLFNFMFSAFEKLKLTISDNSKISADYLTRESNSKLIIAIREALANSIIHCDFLNHKGVFIIRYPDRMIFINGGSLRISKEDYFTGAHSTPRNHYIQEIFRLINICEKAGTEIPKIMNAVKEYQLKKPEVKAEIDSFELTICIENLNISNEVEKGIIELIIQNKFCSRVEIEKELKISKTTTIKYLNSLKEKNILVSSKIGKVHVYKFNDTEQHLEKYNMVNTLYSIIEEIKRN
jgi:divergent AAA domain protein